MFTVQGKFVALDRFESKKTKEMLNVLSLYSEIENFGKVKPKIFEAFFPDTLRSLESCFEKEVILPCSPQVRDGKIEINITDGWRSVLVKNEKGEFQKLNKRPESLSKSA
ncbi:MAG: hypothetical protein VW455_13120 [Nitrospinota bacterium]